VGIEEISRKKITDLLKIKLTKFLASKSDDQSDQNQQKMEDKLIRSILKEVEKTKKEREKWEDYD